MRFGIIGPGGWGRRVTKTLVANGAEIYCHVRKSDEPMEGMGLRMSMNELWTACSHRLVDAVAAFGPPEVVREAYEWCRDLRTPAILTKPLFIERVEPEIKSAMIVDYVRLWSPRYKEVRETASALMAGSEGRPIHVDVDMYGPGPVRGFSSLWDYGPHAVAFLMDVLAGQPGGQEIAIGKAMRWPGYEHGEMFHVRGHAPGNVTFDLHVGNGSRGVTSKRVRVTVGDEFCEYDELPGWVETTIRGEKSHHVTPNSIDHMVKSFLRDVVDDTFDPTTLTLTVEITRFLRGVESLVRQ